MERIILDGFASEYEYERDEGGYKKIFFPVTGAFVQKRDDPSTCVLYDGYGRHLHPMRRVSIAWSVSSKLEGKKKFPRPYEYDDDPFVNPRAKLLRTGEIVVISYIEGNIYKPLVQGAIESLGAIGQIDFLRMDPKNLDRQCERYETKEVVYESETDGKGDYKIKIVARENGTGNIEFEIVGMPEHGNITLNLNGFATINQKNADAKIVNRFIMMNTKDSEKIVLRQQMPDGEMLQEITLDNTKDNEAVTITDKHKNIIRTNNQGVMLQGQDDQKLEHSLYGETVNAWLKDLLTMLRQMKLMTKVGLSEHGELFPPNKTRLDNLESRLPKLLTD